MAKLIYYELSGASSMCRIF